MDGAEMVGSGVEGEVRETSTTGGAKGRKLARFSLLPYDALWALAEHFGRGAKKYTERNWEQGYPWSWTVDAMLRHFTAFWDRGEDVDAETGSLHVVAFAWHALVLVAFVLRKVGTDDRRQRKAEAKAEAVVEYFYLTGFKGPRCSSRSYAPPCRCERYANHPGKHQYTRWNGSGDEGISVVEEWE